ncbi:MAG: serine/threonine-protein phosphatase [Hyphomicrobiales bacterium]|nr:serine/threonine-protein phosphatase [Hyphomicrobiales bacterium]
MNDVFAFRTAWVSHVGLARELNEDSVLVKPEIGLWAVADGMGGHGGGELASRAVVEALTGVRPSKSARQLLDQFERTIVRVNSDLRALASSRGVSVVGTTLVSLMIHGSHYACAWCGDSRAYLRRDGALLPVSRDHSEVQELIDRGLLDDEGARRWPRRNVVTRALGASDRAELELVDGPLSPGDRFLLCSDGLTAHVIDREIAALIGCTGLQRAVDELLQLALDRGASDNVSIVLVDCER